MFVGDIMVHARQIEGARYADLYDFKPCFQYIREELDSSDFVIGNLECTLSGPPYSGYPNFRAPDELAQALKETGFNCLLTANNHVFDGGKSGLRRTLRVLDTLQIAHTGTFEDSLQRKSQVPLVLESNNIRTALLNYTYGMNYFPRNDSAVVNRILKDQIAEDVAKARSLGVDEIVMYFHWGREYQAIPEKSQTELVAFCRSLGVKIILGCHPHVLQNIEAVRDSSGSIAGLAAYSLGNFISDYVTPERTGGAILKIVLEKDGTAPKIAEAGYILTWVVRIPEGSRQRYYVVAADRLESFENLKPPADQRNRMQRFLKNTRNRLATNPGQLPEYRWDASNKNWYVKPD
jgi:poly-gamma-glutamate synthesis protein (capsule biosynthesis protein)